MPPDSKCCKGGEAGDLTIKNLRDARSTGDVARLEGGRRDDTSSFDRRRTVMQLRRVE